MGTKNQKKPKQSRKKYSKLSNPQEIRNEVKEPIEVGAMQSLGGKRFKIDYKIINSPGFASVVMNLKKGQKIISQFGCMAYMNGNIKTETTSRGGIFSGIKRALFTGSSMFMTNYSCVQDGSEICFHSHLPGDILPIVVRSREKIMISPHSLVCFTDNLSINTKQRLRGYFSSEGVYQTEFENKTDHDGIVFLASYGGHQKVKVKKGEQLILDNGLFLCSHSSTKYTISMLGSFKTALLSGEGVIMKFNEECDIYTQGRNVNNLLYFLSKHLPAKK